MGFALNMERPRLRARTDAVSTAVWRLRICSGSRASCRRPFRGRPGWRRDCFGMFVNGHQQPCKGSSVDCGVDDANDAPATRPVDRDAVNMALMRT